MTRRLLLKASFSARRYHQTSVFLSWPRRQFPACFPPLGLQTPSRISCARLSLVRPRVRSMDEAATTRAEEIFYTALELSGEERGRFLSLQCGDDAGLRDSVEELLAAHDGAGRFLTRPVDSQRVAAALRANATEERE